MRITSDQLAHNLQRGLGAFYLIFGDEALLALEAADLLRARARQAGFSERHLFIVDTGFDWKALLAEGNSLSLFAEKRILELRIPSGKPGKEGAEALQRYCARLPEDTLSLLCLPALDRQTQASKWFQAVEAAGVAVEARAVSREQLPRWLLGRLAAQGQQADAATLDFLASRVEGNLLAAHQEIQKLGLLFDAGMLALDDVKQSVLDVARYDAFTLGPAILSGDRVQFVRVLEGLRGEGVAPPLILWALTEEARALGRVLSLLESGVQLEQALRDARVWGARRNLMPQAVRRVNGAIIKRALHHASDIDRLIKGLGSGDAWDELLQLGLGLMRPATPVTRGNQGRISTY